MSEENLTGQMLDDKLELSDLICRTDKANQKYEYEFIYINEEDFEKLARNNLSVGPGRIMPAIGIFFNLVNQMAELLKISSVTNKVLLEFDLKPASKIIVNNNPPLMLPVLTKDCEKNVIITTFDASAVKYNDSINYSNKLKSEFEPLTPEQVIDKIRIMQKG